MSIYSDEFREMTWAEFSSLLQGLGADTPLAKMAQIRLEDDKNILKNFTPAQQKIRSKWRSRNAQRVPEAAAQQALQEFEKLFAGM